MEYPAVVETFTIAEAAAALGKSDITLRRWISEDLIPEPVLRDTTRGYRHYSVGELRVVARILYEHEREFAYYSAQHEATRIRLGQALHGYRALYI